MKLFRTFFLFSVSLFGALCVFAQEVPQILWVSNPVQPGETVMFYGGNWDSSAKIKLESGTILEPVSVTETNIAFLYPENQAGKILKGAVICGEKESKPFSVNAPDVWWVHGDWGKEASPGGWIRVFGTAIEMEPDQTALFLSPVGKNSVPITIAHKNEKFRSQSSTKTHGDRWNIGGTLPNNLPAGEYEVFLEAGGVTTLVGTITIKPHQEVWKTEVFDVTDFGAVANDGFDDTPAVVAALEKVKANGGGILHFPRGRFQITDCLTLPPRTLLRGESRELTQLYWPDKFEPPPALILGTHSFGIEDVTLFSGNHLDGIVSNRLHEAENGNITIRRIRTRLMFTQYLYLSNDELARRAVRLHPKRVLRLGDDFVRVLDCDLFASGSGIYEFEADNAQIANNRMSKGQAQGWNGFCDSRMIIENNHIIGPMCTSFYGRREGSQNIY